MEDCAPDCATARAASIAGILAAAVMANEMSLFDRVLPAAVSDRISTTLDGDAQYDMLQYATDFREGIRVAHLMIEARARASVRVPPTEDPAVDVSATALSRIGDSLSGPGRSLDPIVAMAADLSEIAGSGYGVDEAALKGRGWTVGEILEYLPDAVKTARGDVGAEP